MLPSELAGSAEAALSATGQAGDYLLRHRHEGGTAARELGKLGFTKVFNLRGGLGAWRQENLPLVRAGARLAQRREAEQ